MSLCKRVCECVHVSASMRACMCVYVCVCIVSVFRTCVYNPQTQTQLTMTAVQPKSPSSSPLHAVVWFAVILQSSQQGMYRFHA